MIRVQIGNTNLNLSYRHVIPTSCKRAQEARMPLHQKNN